MVKKTQKVVIKGESSVFPHFKAEILPKNGEIRIGLLNTLLKTCRSGEFLLLLKHVKAEKR